MPDSHRGICLKFSLKNWPEMRSALLRVDYSMRQIQVNLTTSDFDSAGLVRAVNLTKHRGWSYEKEWRALGKTSGEYDFPPAALVRSYSAVGHLAVTSYASKARLKMGMVKFYEAKKREGEFALDICPTEFHKAHYTT